MSQEIGPDEIIQQQAEGFQKVVDEALESNTLGWRNFLVVSRELERNLLRPRIMGSSFLIEEIVGRVVA